MRTGPLVPIGNGRGRPEVYWELAECSDGGCPKNYRNIARCASGDVAGCASEEVLCVGGIPGNAREVVCGFPGDAQRVLTNYGSVADDARLTYRGCREALSRAEVYLNWRFVAEADEG